MGSEPLLTSASTRRRASMDVPEEAVRLGAARWWVFAMAVAGLITGVWLILGSILRFVLLDHTPDRIWIFEIMLKMLGIGEPMEWQVWAVFIVIPMLLGPVVIYGAIRLLMLSSSLERVRVSRHPGDLESALKIMRTTAKPLSVAAVVLSFFLAALVALQMQEVVTGAYVEFFEDLKRRQMLQPPL